MDNYYSGSPETLFRYWQDGARAKKFLDGGTRTPVLDEVGTRYHTYYSDSMWLDVGTGAGFPLHHLQRWAKPRVTAGVDISHAMLQNHMIGDAGKVLGSAVKLPTRSASFTFVSSFFCFSDYPLLDPFFSEMTRVCVPNGHVLYVDYAKGDEYWETRRAMHGHNGIVGNINLRSPKDIVEAWSRFSVDIIDCYVFEAIVEGKKLGGSLVLPSQVRRKFMVCLVAKQ